MLSKWNLMRQMSQLLGRNKQHVLNNNKFIHTGIQLLAANVQQPAPAFKGMAVVNGDFKEIKLDDFKGKYLVLFFYPLDFTFVCPTEIISFSDRMKEFHDLNTAVVGVSVDSHFSHLAWCNTERKMSQLLGRNKQHVLNNNKFIHTGIQLLAANVQQPAPAFKGMAVVNGDFKEIKLDDFKGKYLVLFFYPLDFTFVCPTEIISFSDRMKEFHDLNTAVVGVSVDSHFSHLAWCNTERKDGGIGKLEYPLLADLTKQISKDYDVLIDNAGISLRGTFIIDKNGTIRQKTVNDLPIGRSIDETLRLIKALQFFENHGEVCPANWDPKENADTIKPDVKGSKEYFKKRG